MAKLPENLEIRKQQEERKMNKKEFVKEALTILGSISNDINGTGFMMTDDAFKLITLCRSTLIRYGEDNENSSESGLTEEYIEELSNREFQNLLYKMCKIKYPELSELWFRIDERETYIELKYKNSIDA